MVISGGRMPARLWQPVAACGGLWRPVAACGGLWPPVAAESAPIANSLQSRSWEPMGQEASAWRLQGSLAPGLAGLLKKLKTRRCFPRRCRSPRRHSCQAPSSWTTAGPTMLDALAQKALWRHFGLSANSSESARAHAHRGALTTTSRRRPSMQAWQLQPQQPPPRAQTRY